MCAGDSVTNPTAMVSINRSHIIANAKRLGEGKKSDRVEFVESGKSHSLGLADLKFF